MPPSDPIDIIATQILFDAKSALANLKNLNKDITDSEKKLKVFKEIIRGVAKQIGGDLELATKAFQKFAKSLGFNPVIIKNIGKELQLTQKIADQLGWSVEAVEKHFAGLAITVYQGTGNIVAWGTTLRSALSQGIPMLTVMQAALMAISTQLAVINGQVQGFGRGSGLFEFLKAWSSRQLGRGDQPLLGAGGAGKKGGGGGDDFIDAEWSFVEDGANKAGEAAKKAGDAGKEAGEKTEEGFNKANNTVNNFGKTVRTAADNMKSLRDFVSTGAGKNFATAFEMAINNAKTFGERVRITQNAIKSLSYQTGASFQQVGSYLKNNFNVPTVQVREAIKNINAELGHTGSRAKSAFEQAISGVNAFRIALGAVISMLLFQAIQAITMFAKESVKQFTELEETLFRISNVEQELSEAGIEISVSGLKKGIRELREELKIFSEEEIAKLVGKVAISTKDLKYSEEQILALAKSIAILNLRSTEVEDLSQTSSKVITSLLSGTTKGVSGLGLQLNDATIEAKALEMGILATGESVTDLSKQEKDLVKLEIILASAALESENFGEFLDTNSAKIRENAATWEDLQVAVGGLSSTVVPALTDIIGAMIDVVNGFKALIPIWDTFKVTSLAVKETILSTLNPMERAQRLAEVFKNIPDAFRAIASESIPRLFAEVPEDAPQWFKDLYGEFLTDTETATAEVEELVGIEDDTTAETLEEIDDKLRDIAIDAQQAREDLEVALSQKQEDLEVKVSQKRADIDTEYVRKEEDAARDLQRKISDIDRDAERDRQKVLEKARDDERKAEEDHQLKLWELKMRYLMDLEDALHARDARQIIRLQREYELDKLLLEKKKKQEDEERQDSLESELEDVEARRQERLQDAQIEYQQKLADLAEAKARELEELNTWKAREEADLALWYQRELEEIDRQTRQKIERLLAGYIEEGKIHEEQQEAIHQILVKYFGENKKLVDDLIAYTAQAFSGMSALAQNAFVQAGSLLNQMGQQVGSIATNPFTSQFNDIPSYEEMVQNQIGGGKKYAEGGSVIATRPTTAVFGERGAELATFTPLTRQGRDVGKLFGAGDMSKGEGRIALDILLSPDLVANIVEESMDGVADVITRVNRSKV